MEKFKLLGLLLDNPTMSQKKIAEHLSISIGKVNYILTELIDDAYIDIDKSNKNYQYRVTEKGRLFLLDEIDGFQKTKLSLHSEKRKKVKNAVILAAGSKEDFTQPVCLMEIEPKLTLLDRTLAILHNNGIEKIFIVTGYKKDAFSDIHLPGNVKMVENTKFQWTGSMASLATVANVLDDDFLLLEDDTLIEEVAIKKLLDHPERDCVLIMNESGTRDEAYVEIKNNHLYKISKDIHQLNRIDGEMAGVSKLSYGFFSEMITEYQSNMNPFMNYEYMLLDVSRKIDVGYLKISDLVWTDIDNDIQLKNAREKIYPLLKRKEEKAKIERLKKYIESALGVPCEDVHNIRAFGGMTNVNYRVTIGEDDLVVRMPGVGTEDFINRQEEKDNLILSAKIGINPEMIYFNAETGLKITRMIPDAETLTESMTKKENIMGMVTDVLLQLHNSEEKMKNDFELFRLMELYEGNIIKAGAAFYEGFEEAKASVYKVKDHYESLTIKKCPTHIDALHQNFIKSGDHKLYLIDWEYSGMFDPLWDLATHSIESEFTKLEEELFLQYYFKRNPTPEEEERILIHKIFQDYLWTMWTIFKEAKGDDFGSYGKDRFTRLKANLQEYNKRTCGVML
ncbi:winged helix-turn-helix transcriptional regulator [Sporosarcina saromensis]|uniref:Winged helix-turn-helix transcriptional regulator n=1 Tax=Sporosarcina saromensis TaxID=359365 RepID=A0ABU4GAP1_9BACL|nr:winged helix-turn-helix transcriptional regulator [Sporosarcina saromensis]MDW0114030.1 winged helix-turn-helix transcriptional regulator [Sporosarcina saromensis]